MIRYQTADAAMFSRTVWNIDTQKIMQRLVGVHTAEMYGCRFSPASRETLATVGFDRVAVVWDARQGKHTEIVSGHADDGESRPSSSLFRILSPSPTLPIFNTPTQSFQFSSFNAH